MASRLFKIVTVMYGAFLLPQAAMAAFFWKSPDFAGAPVTGAEPGILTMPLPGATPEELRAALVWNLRSGLNVAALQCQFEPTLLTRNQYNAMLDNHRGELADAYRVLSDYFKRTDKKNAQTKLDQYGTRTYSSFSTVSSQYTFCEAASDIGAQAIFAPRGQLHAVASGRMRELRNSLGRAGEQQFLFWIPPYTPALPPFDDRCWKDGELRYREGCVWTRG